jgi:hypothetical protein
MFFFSLQPLSTSAFLLFIITFFTPSIHDTQPIWTFGPPASTISLSLSLSLTYTHNIYWYVDINEHFPCSTGYECVTDKAKGHGKPHERSKKRNPFPLIRFWRTRCRGLRMLYERTDHRYGSIPFSPNLAFGLLISWRLGVLTVWLGLRVRVRVRVWNG